MNLIPNDSKNLSRRSVKSSEIKSLEILENEHLYFEKIFMDNTIGYGIFVKKDFYPGDVLLEYKGKLLTRLEAEKAHEEYHSKNEGCFIFDVDWKNAKMSIDATYSSCLGRFINDAPEKFSNCRPKTHIIKDKPHLLFFAKVYIPTGTELRYDYGDRKNQNWRGLRNYIHPFTMEEVRNSRFVGKKLEKKVVLTASKVLSAFAVKTPDKQKSVNESNVFENLSSENFNRIFGVKCAEGPQFLLQTQVPLLSTDVHFDIFSSNKNENAVANYSLENLNEIFDMKSFEDPICLLQTDVDECRAIEILFCPSNNLPKDVDESRGIDICSSSNNLPNDVNESCSIDICCSSNNIPNDVDESCGIDICCSSKNLSNDVDKSRGIDICCSSINLPNDADKDFAENSIDDHPKEMKVCPVCKCEDDDLRTHVREAHNWSIESSLAVICQFGLRKPMKKKENSKWKNLHYTKMCPLPNCYAATKNIGEHLKSKKHGLKVGEEYYALLKSAKHFDFNLNPKNIEESPKKNFGLYYRPKNNIKINKRKSAPHINILESENNIPTNNDCLTDTKLNSEQHFTLPVISDIQAVSYTNTNSKCHSSETYFPIPIASEIKAVDLPTDIYLQEESSFSSVSSDSEYEPPCKLEKLQCSYSVEKVLSDFYNYLVGPDRNRQSRSISKVVQDVRRIFLALDLTSCFASIFKLPKIFFRDKYLVEYCVKRNTRASSIRKYMGSFIDFCKFLISEEVGVSGVRSDEINMTKLKIEDWRKSYKRKEKLQTQQKKIVNYEKLLTPEHLSIYLNHEHALNAKKIFFLLTQNPLIVLSQTEYCCIRDYLYIVIGFSNASRSGVLSNMTLGEFHQASEVENTWVIPVWDHKTATDYGPAEVTVDNEHYQELKIFIYFARNKVSSKGFDNVFLSWSGNKVSSGEISDRLNSLFTKVGIRSKSAKARLCFNDLRRSTSTFVRDKKKGFEEEVAHAMNHSKLTSDIHYDTKNRKQSVAIGTKIIREHFFSGNPPNTPKKVWSKDETDILKKSFIETGCSSPTLTSIKNNINEFANINASPTQICSKFRSLKRYEADNIKKLDSSVQQKLYLWEPEDLNALVTIGKEFIDGGSVTKKRVENVLGNTPLFSKFSLSQIRTRINYEKSKKCNTNKK